MKSFCAYVSGVEGSARLAGRFLDESAAASLRKTSLRLARLAAMTATPAARSARVADRLPALLERLARDVGQLRLDDDPAIVRVERVVAEMEEMMRGNHTIAT